MRASRKRQILPPGDEPITPADLIERTKACERRRAWFARRRSKAAGEPPMTEERAKNAVLINVDEMAVLIVEALTATIRKPGIEPTQLMADLACDPRFTMLAAGSKNAALNIAAYIKLSADTAMALKNLGAI